MIENRFRLIAHSLLWSASGICLAAGLIPLMKGQGVDGTFLAVAVVFFVIGIGVARKRRCPRASAETHL